MPDLLFVSTRKGLFTLERAAGSQPWRIAQVDFLGDPLSMFLRNPRDGARYAALNLGHFGAKLRRSDDEGRTWTEVAVPTFPAESTLPAHPMFPPESLRGRVRPAAMSEFWALEPGGASEPGVLWAGTIPGGLFRSDDRGASWSLVDALWNLPERDQWFGGGKDDPGIHSVCVDPRDPRHLAIAVSCGGVWHTFDGGATWSPRTRGMRAAYMPPELQSEPSAQDPHRMVQCAAAPDVYWLQHHNGIFKTENAGERWEELTDVPPSTFGFAVAVHPRDPQTAWFVPGVKDECRLPVDARFVVTRTRDGGRTFESLTRGLPSGPAYDLVYRHALDVDSSGERLAVGSTTGGLWTTDDGGETWTPLEARLPPVYAVRFG